MTIVLLHQLTYQTDKTKKRFTSRQPRYLYGFGVVARGCGPSNPIEIREKEKQKS